MNCSLEMDSESVWSSIKRNFVQEIWQSSPNLFILPGAFGNMINGLIYTEQDVESEKSKMTEEQANSHQNRLSRPWPSPRGKRCYVTQGLTWQRKKQPCARFRLLQRLMWIAVYSHRTKQDKLRSHKKKRCSGFLCMEHLQSVNAVYNQLQVTDLL